MISAILLAGGIGTRMHSPLPKVFLPIHDVPMVLYSLFALSGVEEIKTIVIITPPQYQEIFSDFSCKQNIVFAEPGLERMYSVASGLQHTQLSEKILIHDAARPFIKADAIKRLIDYAKTRDAVTYGHPISNALKHVTSTTITRSIPKRTIWESYTPQIINTSLLTKGIDYCLKHNILPEDDIEMVSYIGVEAHILKATEPNIKITTPKDKQYFELLTPPVYV